jgi:Carboxypeptidase regulatory-like domain
MTRPALPKLTLLAALLLAACTPGASAGPTTGGSAAPSPTAAGSTYTLQGKAAAGPTCPVEQAPPQSQCAPRPVAGAVLVITNAAGQEVARVTTDESGAFTAAVPAGSYTITPQPIDGLMGVAPPVSVTVDANGNPGPIALEYDTGIR